MEPSKEAIAVRLTRLNRQILGKVTSTTNNYRKKVIDRETLLDALTVLYDECNEDIVKKGDDLIREFLDKYRSVLAELRRTRVCLADFDMLQLIGRGHFGEVHIVREKQTGDVYALKTLRKESAISRPGVACYEEERDVLAAGAAPWIVKLQYAFQDSSHLYLVMELCAGGDLAALLARRARPLPERDAAFYVAEAAHALRALHALGYVHRDLKPHNILLDRCGHVKLCDFGSSRRLCAGGGAEGEGARGAAVGTPDYVAPELLAAATCAHADCLQYCRRLLDTAVSACDYWSLGVVAFELVTLRRPFTTGDNDSLAHTLANIQQYERQAHPAPPFDPLPADPSPAWRSLVSGLLRVQPTKRFHYLDTLQHPALEHLSPHNIRDQVPPWVPLVRGPEDASHFAHLPRRPPSPDALPFRTRAPFAGHLPFIGFSYVAPDESEEHSTAFNASHDCTAIDLATYKSVEKLSALRAREVSRLQARLAAAEAEAEAARAALDGRALHHVQELQDRLAGRDARQGQLEKELEAEKEERRKLERTNDKLLASAKERTSSELKAALSRSEELQGARDALEEEKRRLARRVLDLEAECERATAAAETARQQHLHYKDSIAKERQLRRQTLTEGSAQAREAVSKLAVAESNAAREARDKADAERRAAELERANGGLQAEVAGVRARLAKVQELYEEEQRRHTAQAAEVQSLRVALAQEQSRVATLSMQVKELERGAELAAAREAALEEQQERTEARLKERLQAAEASANEALHSDSRHREKVKTLENLVRQLEREVSALETRGVDVTEERKRDGMSDTESVSEADIHASDPAAQAQVALLKEQLDKCDAQLQARNEEIAVLKQETRTANLARWRKEREVGELTTELKSSERAVKRLEERVSAAAEARRAAEQKAAALQTELDTLRPEVITLRDELAGIKERFAFIQKANATFEAEVDRSRNDIRKLKSELEYSEKRRIHAETQEELASRERAALRDEAAELRHTNTQLAQNNKALQEACTVLEEQLTDLEKLADLHEVKNKDLETEAVRIREELSQCRARLAEAERAAAEGRAAAALAARQGEEARDSTNHAHCQINLLRERLESREARVSELELALGGSESARGAAEAAVCAAARRVRGLQEECSQLRTRNVHHHAQVLQLQAQLADAQEELAGTRDAADAAAVWWRTRETKAEATLRQQAKLIDFLQAKLEEANRKKSSLGNKLFGSKGRRAAVASPPLRKANRELREELDRLRARLSNSSFEPTPKKPLSSKSLNGLTNIDTPDGRRDTNMQLIWSEKKRTSQAEPCDKMQRDGETGLAAEGLQYRPTCLATVPSPPHAALLLADDAIAIGCAEGLRSVHGPVRVECEESGGGGAVTCVAAGGPGARAWLVRQGALLHAALPTLTSALRRAATLQPALKAHAAQLTDLGPIDLLQVVPGEEAEGGWCAAVSSGRRVVVLRYDAATATVSVVKRHVVERAPAALLLTARHLYVAADRPLRAVLPRGDLEPFAAGDTTVAAARARRSGPRALLSLRRAPLELLLCYAECGVFLQESGARSRPEDARWPRAVQHWRHAPPYLYAVCADAVHVSRLDEEARPPCTCDDASSTAGSDTGSAAPQSYRVPLADPHPLGETPAGVLVRSPLADGRYAVLLVEGAAVLKSVGASVESLDSVPADRGRAEEEEVADVAEEAVEAREEGEREEETTGFLADIRKRASQLRERQRREHPDDIIKGILTAEVGTRRSAPGRRSPATVSGCSTDTDSEPPTTPTPSDICADMFARQVRFH